MELFQSPAPDPENFTLGVRKKKGDLMDKKAFRLGVQSALNAQQKSDLDKQQAELQSAIMQFMQLQAQGLQGQQAISAAHQASMMQAQQPQGPSEVMHYHVPIQGGQPQQ